MEVNLSIENDIFNFNYKGLYHRFCCGYMEAPLQRVKSHLENLGLEAGLITSLCEDRLTKQATNIDEIVKKADKEGGKILRTFCFNPVANITIGRAAYDKAGSIGLDSFDKEGSKKLLEDLIEITGHKIDKIEEIEKTQKSVMEAMINNTMEKLSSFYSQTMNFALDMGIKDLNTAYGLLFYTRFLDSTTNMSLEHRYRKALLKFRFIGEG